MPDSSAEPLFDSDAVVSVVTEHAQHWDAEAERFYWAKRVAAFTEWEREGWVEDLRARRDA